MGRPGNKRLTQYLVVIALIILISYLKNYRFDLVRSGLFFVIIFVVNFLLTWYRENRRATIPPSDNVDWHFFEAILYLSSLIGFLVVAIYYGWPEKLFYSYFYPAVLAFLGGTCLGEYLYQRIRLPKLSSLDRDRYWLSYKDSII